MTTQQVEQMALRLPQWEQLRLARLLLDNVLSKNGNRAETEDSVDEESPQNALMEWAGIYSGKPDTASRAKEILLEEVDPVYGLGIR